MNSLYSNATFTPDGDLTVPEIGLPSKERASRNRSDTASLLANRRRANLDPYRLAGKTARRPAIQEIGASAVQLRHVWPVTSEQIHDAAAAGFDAVIGYRPERLYDREKDSWVQPPHSPSGTRVRATGEGGFTGAAEGQLFAGTVVGLDIELSTGGPAFRFEAQPV